MVRGPGRPSSYRGREEIGGVLDQLAGFERTLHAVLAQEVRFEGEEAGGEVAMCAHHVRRLGGEGRAGDGERREGEDLVMYGRYFDRYARDADGSWCFAARRLEVGWTELRPVRMPG